MGALFKPAVEKKSFISYIFCLNCDSRHNTFVHFLYIAVDCDVLADTEHNISLKVPSA